MAAWAFVEVDMEGPLVHEPRHQAGLLAHFPLHGDLERFTGIDVPARLQPDPESAVPVEQHVAVSVNDDPRRCHMRRIGRLAEGVREPVQQGADPIQAVLFAMIDRRMMCQGVQQLPRGGDHTMPMAVASSSGARRIPV